MRVIAGKFRSQPLVAPKGWKTRPTSDRLRETLFNVIAPQIKGAVFADLFAGTGAIGIEALSREAKHVYFAENAKTPLAALRANIEKFGLGTEADIEACGTLPLLRRLLKEGIRLDFVYLDPPYSDHLAYKSTLQFLAENAVVNPGRIIIAEHARRSVLLEPSGLLESYRRIEQGDAALTFFRCNAQS
ncbi:MAG: 16S rRNA (guanine(966)-N(2))-methyltransferase RsmD [Ktedonobacteraceae bacterium]|nr:16S rRNA (guanine(966)-N(2))-methyltransferase RsmD [Ktedonobacteraceae bacterium]MBA3916743.1 16S rRNA (guanine(966)-N(2))-methyltransferase RsmD [Terriglobales bacterium]